MTRTHTSGSLASIESARRIRTEYYTLVEALSAIRVLSDIDLRIVSERELLSRAAEALVECLDFEQCKIILLRERVVETVVVAHAHRTESGSQSGSAPGDSGDRPTCASDVEFSPLCGNCLGDSPMALPNCPHEADDPACVPVGIFDGEVAVIHAYSRDTGDLQTSRRRTLVVFVRFLGQMMKSHRLFNDMESLVDAKIREIADANDRLRQEIDVRRRVENQVRDAKERFKDFAEVAADWFWETGPDLEVTFLSERYQQVTGIDPHTVIGRPYQIIANGSDIGAWEKHVDELKLRRPFKNFRYVTTWPNGDARILSVNGKPVYDNDGVFRGYRGAGQDVSQTQKLSDELAYNATHDSLTGLINRRQFEVNLQQLIAETKSHRSEHYLCYLDLDQFKVINDTCGHEAGDALLCQLAQSLPTQVRKADVFARLGGDEFGLLIKNCSAADATRIANSLYQTIQEFRFSWDSSVFSLGVSIGLVPINEHTQSVTSVLSAADTACYVAKSEGRNRIHINNENGMQLVRSKREMQWVSKITRALEENRFKLVFQPIVSVLPDYDHGIRYELLVRMQDETGKLIMPGEFLPSAERYSMSARIDRWVVDAGLNWLAGHPAHVKKLDSCSINLSGHSIGDREFLRYLEEQFEQEDIPADKICFEITETAALADVNNTQAFMQKFQARGCKFALDDFGSGLSSFAYLKTLPVDYVKIDGLFIRDIAEGPIEFAMVKSINEISQMMGKQTIAEYVENDQALEMLRRIGVNYAQGFGISRPLPLNDEEINAYHKRAGTGWRHPD